MADQRIQFVAHLGTRYLIPVFVVCLCTFQVLDSVRGQLSRSSGARMEMGRIIEEEAAFLLRRKGATVAAYQQ